ncbi:MAG: BON domain-containing protein [Burkholderiales bacterium]|nr:BON domain-containing protein [Burkholderiales bacterium]MBK8666910.1 BON domain-containing protein [Burkholderiales bacterium]
MTRITSRLLALPLLAAGTALLVGCAGGGYGYGYDSPREGPMSNREAARQAQEQNIQDRVMAALRADPRVGAQGLTVHSQGDGVIVIGGTPANGVAGRDLALRIAQGVWGVRHVVNNMVVN